MQTAVATQTVLETTPLHSLSMSVAASPYKVVVTLLDYAPTLDNTAGTQRLENVMVWVDGVLVLQYYTGGVVRTLDNPQTVRYTATIDMGVTPLDDGDHVVVVGAFQTDAGDAGYVSLPLRVVPRNVPAVVPGVIPRVAFHADPDTLKANPVLLAAYIDAGFNAVMSNVFNNPGDNSTITTYDQWVPYSLDVLRAKLDWCRANGLMFWGTGDDFVRSADELTWTTTTPWAEQAIRATFALARDYPEFVAISMVDEMPGLPGDNPIYGQLAQWCREERGPRISWPNQRTTRDEPWEDPSVADFADRYYSLGVLTWRNGLPQQGTGWQYGIEIDRTASQTRTGQPFAYQVGVCGPFYTKKVPGSQYQAGQDFLKALGVAPNTAVLGVWLPLAYGASALRAYALDTFWAGQRANDPVNKDEQTGLQFGTAVGDAIGHALRAVARYEGSLLGGFRTPLKLGTWVVGRRSSGLEFWVNTADTPQTCPVAGGREVVTPVGPAPFTNPVGPGCVVIV